MNELTIINNYFTEDCISQMPEEERRRFQETCNSIEENATKKYITELGDLVSLSGFIARQKEEDFKSKIPEFLNVIVLVRNELMYGEDYSTDVFQNLISSCDAVCNYLGVFAESDTIAPDLDTSKYKDLYNKANKIKSQLNDDVQFAAGFLKMRRAARDDYHEARDRFDRLDPCAAFFQIAARSIEFFIRFIVEGISFGTIPSNMDDSIDKLNALREPAPADDVGFVNAIAYNDYIKKQRELLAKQQESGKSESGGYSV